MWHKFGSFSCRKHPATRCTEPFSQKTRKGGSAVNPHPPDCHGAHQSKNLKTSAHCQPSPTILSQCPLSILTLQTATRLSDFLLNATRFGAIRRIWRLAIRDSRLDQPWVWGCWWGHKAACLRLGATALRAGTGRDGRRLRGGSATGICGTAVGRGGPPSRCTSPLCLLLTAPLLC